MTIIGSQPYFDHMLQGLLKRQIDFSNCHCTPVHLKTHFALASYWRLQSLELAPTDGVITHVGNHGLIRRWLQQGFPNFFNCDALGNWELICDPLHRHPRSCNRRTGDDDPGHREAQFGKPRVTTCEHLCSSIVYSPTCSAWLDLADQLLALLSLSSPDPSISSPRSRSWQVVAHSWLQVWNR